MEYGVFSLSSTSTSLSQDIKISKAVEGIYLFCNLSTTILLFGHLLAKFKTTVEIRTDFYRFRCSGDDQS